MLDCKSLFDAITRIESSGLQLKEKRTAIEVVSLKQRIPNSRFKIKWVNGDQQLADGLTKINPSA